MNQYNPDESVLKVFSRPIALKYRAIPLSVTGRKLQVVFASRPSANDLSDLIFFTGLDIETVLSSPEILESLIAKYYPETIDANKVDDNKIQFEQQSGASLQHLGKGRIVDRVNTIIGRAASMHASDIHFEPGDCSLDVRYRIDGVLQEMASVPMDEQAAVVSRIKLMAGMDIAERRLPQDGRITMRGLDEVLDIRVSSVPTRTNEKLVLRLLNKSAKLKDLSQLGMSEADLVLVRKHLSRPQGMILVSGPTGSGKSTTLYGALTHLARPGVNIMTIEDPIEYEVSGITQSQVKPEIKYDFSTALRAFLRQDPDIIMVGEIRDYETAQIAVRAAMTGHLVLSTVHTNDAASTITRLIDIGIEPYLVASSISLVIAQRLMRTFCPNCRGDVSALGRSSATDSETADDNQSWKSGRGCGTCNGTGYRGRVGVFEVLEMTDEVREAIQNRSPAHMIDLISREKGVPSLSAAAMKLVAARRTSLEELHRVLPG